MTRPQLSPALVALGALWLLAASAGAQFDMPDMKQMSGVPRPVGDLPDATVAVRLVRGSLSNNISGHPVELVVQGKPRPGKTGDTGHVQFDGLPAGATVKAVSVVDGELLESQEFPVPAKGGVRLLLVATDKSAAAALPVSQEPIAGTVVLGGQSRIVVEPGDEALAVYYLLDFSNTARAPVNPPQTILIDLPTGARGAAVMEGSSPQASVKGTRLAVQGPFKPGLTSVQIAFELPVSGGSLEFSQTFPATMEQFALVVKQTGAITVRSTNLASQQQSAGDNGPYIMGSGPAVAAGKPLVVALDELPHHSAVPRWLALGLAGSIIIVGFVYGGKVRGAAAGHVARRRQLEERRERIFGELVRLGEQHRSGRVDGPRRDARHEELLHQLEQIYSELDQGPGPRGDEGLTA